MSLTTSYIFTTFTDPEAVNQVGISGISELGTISGYYLGTNSIVQGFIEFDGTFTTITDPAGTIVPAQYSEYPGTYVDAVDAVGEAVGFYIDSSQTMHGFIENAGTFITLDDPNANMSETIDNTATGLSGINASGTIVGQYQDTLGVSHGFVYNNGSFTEIDDPNADAIYDSTISGTTYSIGFADGTSPIAINDSGTVAGFYFTSASVFNGFIESNGTYTTINDPNAVSGQGGGTDITGINDSGTLVGWYIASNNTEEGFIEANGTFTTIIDPISTLGTELTGISNTGEITGAYDTASGKWVPFTAQIACFLQGSKILTESGPVPVEHLAIGDRLPTQHGGLQKIKWIGARAYAAPFCNHEKILPIRIHKHAIADNVPENDLYVSSGHAICIDGQLVNAGRLRNGVTITQAERAEQIVYYHIELETHDIIWAENCPVETFMDESFRAQFHNAATYQTLYPHSTAPATACLPQLTHGFALFAIQRRLARRAGLPAPADTFGPMRGHIDDSGPGICRGWAQSITEPEHPVTLIITVGGTYAGHVLANMYREDLYQAGLGSGHHAFALTLLPNLTGPITVRRSVDGAALAPARLAA